ncbi:branched-chain amino acid ABC transporter permease [Halomarina salina]|uniref:Branched-chain amino acid ABC transporter permease n=1 Tax=Halomarina salina TaxID=1872699 RepID=A0ABD5RHE5_9EURY|nr:branched-chain amino acid ABC transporter permease [Halomarina salina]
MVGVDLVAPLQASPSTVLVQIVILSSLYALVALGFTLIFGVGGVLNLAHGASITIGAFVAYVVTAQQGFGGFVGLAAAFVVTGLVSGVYYLALIKRIEDEPIMVMIITLVTSVAVEEVIRFVYGSQAKVLTLVGGRISLAGSTVTYTQLVAFGLSALLIAALFAFVNYTPQGKALLATSMTKKGAALVGIEADRINLLVWVGAGALAGVAGVFLGATQGAFFAMGRGPLVLSFSIVVLGGIGSIRGSVLGAFVVGALEVLTVQYVDSSLTGLTPLLVLVVVLLLRPEGLFGRELVEA